MSANTDKLLASVQAQTTVVDSLVQLVTNISQLLKDSGVDSAVIAQVEELVNTNSQKMSDAILANTPEAV